MVSLCHQTQLFWAFVLDSSVLPTQTVTIILGLTTAWVGACYAGILSSHDGTEKSELVVQRPGSQELDLVLFLWVWLLPVCFCSRWMILVSRALKSLDPHGVLYPLYICLPSCIQQRVFLGFVSLCVMVDPMSVLGKRTPFPGLPLSGHKLKVSSLLLGLCVYHSWP